MLFLEVKPYVGLISRQKGMGVKSGTFHLVNNGGVLGYEASILDTREGTYLLTKDK